MYKNNGMLFSKNKEVRKNQKLIENFLGKAPSKITIGYNNDWNELNKVFKQIGDILFDDLTPDLDVQLIEKSFENLDYWILSNDINTAYDSVIIFIKKYFDEDE